MTDPNEGFPRSLTCDAETKGALAGPETAAEHVRNALQLLSVIERADFVEGGDEEYDAVKAARARLARALAALEGADK